MQAARKIECFSVDKDERLVFVGNIAGQVDIVDLESFEILRTVQAHAGAITAIQAHPALPYLACLSMDRSVSIWRYAEDGTLGPLAAMSLRNIRPSNDERPVPDVHSNSQMLAFHDSAPRLVTRTANAGVLQLQFDEAGNVEIVHCLRHHAGEDVISARYANRDDRVLTGSAYGEVALSDGSEVLGRWKVGDHAVHWIEFMHGTQYLAATDDCHCARFDIAEPGKVAAIGSKFARDDFEQVTYNPTDGRVFASAFDRKIYELDPKTCESLGAVFRTNFKNRWIRGIRRDPRLLVVQARNGTLYKADVGTGECLARLKETPAALWTGTLDPEGRLLFAGEGDRLLRLAPRDVERSSLRRRFASSTQKLDVDPEAYTKRMEVDRQTGALVLGRTDGRVYSLKGDRLSTLAELDGAVRDLAMRGETSEAFVACEDGCVYHLDTDSGRMLSTWSSPSGFPVWALAYNPERDLLAICERHNEGVIVSASDFDDVAYRFESGRNKRTKWLDGDRLFHVYGSGLNEIDLTAGREQVIVDYTGNTIEDFVWDPTHTYLLLVGYTTMINLYDLATGEHLAEVPDQVDYSKGLVWLPRHPNDGSYPFDFATFGRSGEVHAFRIYNENIVALGNAAEFALPLPDWQGELVPRLTGAAGTGAIAAE